ncbi:hypothetical protein IP92_05597 [Pseudoduganella flava]|uniref:Uncharacterized protein n=1 Tax=Pseudoduganella flava TaxID=871742 RepID=A0A562PCI5_9BURK|nr:hypothetical protein [Pseudoduganella flava]QGZ40049.1 hypothetical protein GO485_13935 [Pseudoduganella flava]TWI42205.1 hypothetical protein IP92_05597 [Pseudoduganella flava]
MNEFYILQYTDQHPGCPTFVAQELNHGVTEWPTFMPDPAAVIVTKEYVLRVTDPEIEDIAYDMGKGDQPCVSAEFLQVCDRVGVPYRAIPAKMELADGRETAKRYFFFLAGASIALLDRTLSDCEEEPDLETGEVLYNTIYPDVPIYAEINRFVPRQIPTPSLFFCPEIFELVCTEASKQPANICSVLPMCHWMSLIGMPPLGVPLPDAQFH